MGGSQRVRCSGTIQRADEAQRIWLEISESLTMILPFITVEPGHRHGTNTVEVASVSLGGAGQKPQRVERPMSQRVDRPAAPTLLAN